MKLERGIAEASRGAKAVVTMGTFDGVHRGHRAILDAARDIASLQDRELVAITFDPHPQAVLRGIEVPLLSTVDERVRYFSDAGVKRVVVLEFDDDLAATPPERFVQSVLLDRVGMGTIVAGYDHGFGRGRSGSRTTLSALGERLGFQTHVVEARAFDDHVVSSSRIRSILMEEGDVGAASELLGRAYELDGTVVPGKARGRSIGFPTANIRPVHRHKLIPMRGVYAVRVWRLNTDTMLAGMMNIGVRPTFGSSDETHLEVHILDFREKIYGEMLRIEFVRRIRDEMRFSSVQELTAQLARDQEAIREVLSVL